MQNNVSDNRDLTVVIPAYRCAPFLPAAVLSAVACGPAAVLIAEDASGDETASVARELAISSRSLVSLTENTSNLGMTAN